MCVFSNILIIEQDSLLAVSNAHEGRIAVPSPTPNATEYTRQLFPKLTDKQVVEAAYQYTSLNETFPTSFDQVMAILGESMCNRNFKFEPSSNCYQHTSFVLLIHSFKPSKGARIRYILAFIRFCSRSNCHTQGEFAIQPANHGDDLYYYFPSCVTCIFDGGAEAKFHNTDFINAFVQPFFSFAKSGDPNAKYDSTNITPPWKLWSSNHSEILFNKTDAGVPDIRSITTDSGLLERCALVNRSLDLMIKVC